MHSHILSHVLKHSFYSPKKRKSVAKWCKALLKCLESESDSEDDFKTPLKNLNEMLRKVTVYRSTKKHKKAKNIAQEINSQESNISSVATLSGSKYSDVYWLMKTPKKRKVNKEYKRRFLDKQKIEATNIYLNEEVSYCLPDRKYSKLHFMSCTIEEAYKNHYLVKSRFKRKLGLTSFTSLKPSFVKKGTANAPLRLQMQILSKFGPTSRKHDWHWVQRLFPRTILAQLKQHGVSFGVIPKYLMIMMAAMKSTKALLQTSFPLKNAF